MQRLLQWMRVVIVWISDHVDLSVSYVVDYLHDAWILDSGPSYYTCLNKDLFASYFINWGTTFIGNNEVYKIVGLRIDRYQFLDFPLS